MPHSFAYLFERFPSFVQTFVYREAVEMVRQGMNPWLVSLRRPEESDDLAEKLDVEVFHAPEEKALRTEVDERRARHELSGRAYRAIPKHRRETDSQRMFEAVWLGPLLRARGIRHVHAHFGGVAVPTAWWLRKLYGLSYSFTGHANDIFCPTDFPVSNADLVRDARFVVTETDYARRWMEEKYPWAAGKVGFPPMLRDGPVGAAGKFVPRAALCREKGLWGFDRGLPVVARPRDGVCLRHRRWRAARRVAPGADRAGEAGKPRASRRTEIAS